MNRQHHAPTPARLARATGIHGFEMPPKHQGCRKRRARTEEQAVAYALWLARRTCTPLRIYECPDCRGWHVTKRPTWEDPR